jgi:hypothetical protein
MMLDGAKASMVHAVKRVLVLVAAASFLVAALQSPASALPAGDPHYPDLVTKSPWGLRLVVEKGSASRRLFFANTIGNVGDGPLELRGENDAATGTTNAFQEIYTHLDATSPKGTTQMTLVSSSLVGTFVFHPAHNHWHMADFARYELRSIDGDGSTGPVVAATDKVSFCMIDTDVFDSTLAHFGMGFKHACGQDARQGLKVGMGDTYSSSLSDQFIDISTVADGTYRLVSAADPNVPDRPGGRLLELNDANNAASVDVVITRSSVTIVPGSERTKIDAPP